jgi:RNase P subunit RPR2
MFSEEHPEFETYYDTEKNERPFNTYSNMSNENAWWKCEKGHSFEQSIMNYSRQGRFECPVCTNKILVKGENDLESQYPDLASEFDIEKNGTTPDMILSSHTNAEIWWKCNEGHEFQRSVWYRVNQVNDCPVCNRSFIIKGVNDFQTAYPDVVKIWDYQKNGRGPDTISDIDTRKYSFKCTLGHQYETQLSTAINHNFECLVCTNEIVKEGINSLLDTHEELAKEFSPKEERKPYEFNKNYSYSIKWKCPTCNGEYRYPINKREFGDDSCPYCNKGRALLGYNSLLDTDFELSKEWSPSNERGPETYIKSTSTWVYWICPTCNGEYTRPINERELSDDSCPYCKGTKLLHGYNSFKVKHEDLMEEWDYTNNYLLCNSEYILDTYSYKVWWICKDCNYKYFMSPRLRIFYQHRNMISCPHCKGLRQKKIHFF